MASADADRGGRAFYLLHQYKSARASRRRWHARTPTSPTPRRVFFREPVERRIPSACTSSPLPTDVFHWTSSLASCWSL